MIELMLQLFDWMMDLLTLGSWSRRRGARLYDGRPIHDR